MLRISQDELLEIEALDWAVKTRQTVQRIRYYIEDDSANILNFFQVRHTTVMLNQYAMVA
jgi:hypothetical protein